jgi:hypothetical protein
LTTAQAIVRYLQAQWSERDGDRRRLIPGIWGIFGHGNVIGLGQAIEEVGDGLHVPPGPERAVDGARCRGIREGDAPPADARGAHRRSGRARRT